MNIVFWMLVFLGSVILWLLLSFVFYPLGVQLGKILRSISHNVNKDDGEGWIDDDEDAEEDKTS